MHETTKPPNVVQIIYCLRDINYHSRFPPLIPTFSNINVEDDSTLTRTPLFTDKSLSNEQTDFQVSAQGAHNLAE